MDRLTAEEIRSEIWTLFAPHHHGVVAFSDVLRLYSSWCTREELETIMDGFVLSKVARRKVDSDGITYLFPEFPRRELRRINIDFEKESAELEKATSAADLIAEVRRSWLESPNDLDEGQRRAVVQYISRFWDREAQSFQATQTRARTNVRKLEAKISELRKLLEGL